ncbi:MAG: ribosome biogenesis GTPase Der, partial [Planctomycetota bacterium]
MSLPVVAIIGRPNVGKSSLLNSLSGQMISIVDPTAGVTRDRVSTIINQDDRYFELVDTGGYGIVDSDALEEHVESQIFQAIGAADVVIFMVDIRDGVMSLDTKIAQLIRKHDLNIILVANKADSPKQIPQAGEFVKLGFGQPICISAKSLVNRAELMDRICEELDHLPKEKPASAVMRVAIVGKRNAGKSTFINSVVGSDRVIASEIPGTTRDAVDVRFEKDGKQYVIRATRSIHRADIVLFMMDATTKISQVDKKLCHLIREEFKPCVIVVNKWDLAKGFADTQDYADYLDKVLVGIRHAPIAFTTATEAKNTQSVLDLTAELFKQANTKVSTGKLNKAIEIISEEKAGGGRKKGGFPKIYYATQVATNPVCILMFVNNPKLFDETYQRFAVNRLGELLGLEEIPIRLL